MRITLAGIATGIVLTLVAQRWILPKLSGGGKKGS